MQCCLGMAGPILHKTIVCAMLAHSPQTTLHRKIIFNVLWICLGQHCTRKLPVQYWTMVNRQRLWGKWPIQCCVDQAGTTLHKNIVYSILPKYVWDKIRKHKKITSAMMAKREQTSFCGKIAYSMLSWSTWINIAQENYFCNVGWQYTNNSAQENNLQFCLDLSGTTLHKEITCAIGSWLADNFYEENNLYSVVPIMLGQQCIDNNFLQNGPSLHVLSKALSISMSSCAAMYVFVCFCLFFTFSSGWFFIDTLLLEKPREDCSNLANIV